MTCGFRLVFDASHKSPTWWFVAAGLPFVVVGLVLLRRAAIRRRSNPGGRSRLGFAAVFLAFAVFWTSSSAVGVFGQWSSVRRAIRAGTPVVQGTVENFHAMPYSGHDEEHFTVQGVYFAYSDYVITPGFNNTSSHGGPIRAGLLVRIHFIGPATRATIVKLEISDCGVQTGPA
jgi:hypothetical protein